MRRFMRDKASNQRSSGSIEGPKPGRSSRSRYADYGSGLLTVNDQSREAILK